MPCVDCARTAEAAPVSCPHTPGRFVDWEGRSWWRRAFSAVTAPLVLLMHATNPSLELGALAERAQHLQLLKASGTPSERVVERRCQATDARRLHQDYWSWFP